MFLCLLRIRKKVAETLPVTQLFLPGQTVESDLDKGESMVDLCYHTERCFQAAQ